MVGRGHAIEDEDSFVQGIQYLIKEGIMTIPPTSQGSSSGSNEIPDWIKNNAGWWAEDMLLRMKIHLFKAFNI